MIFPKLALLVSLTGLAKLVWLERLKKSGASAHTMPLLPDWQEFIALLNSHAVDYPIVGGWARAFHGVPRSTGATDLADLEAVTQE